MWGLVLSAVTIAISMATSKSSDDKAVAKKTITTLESRFSHTFVSGICLGVGLHLLLTTLLQQFRIVERFRLYMTKQWETKEAFPWRLPNPLLLNGDATTTSSHRILVQNEFGTVRLLVSFQDAATSTLHMTLITIRPGCEMIATRAASLEVYQVVKGFGRVSQQGIVESCTVETGDLWVVDPGSMRWISNHSTDKKTTEDLVLLRTVDRSPSSSPYASPTHVLNRIAMDPNKQTLSLYEKFTASIRQKMGRIVSNLSFSTPTNT